MAQAMPIYVDFHPSAELSLAAIKIFLHAAQRGTADEYGVCPLELFCGEDGNVFCVHTAASEAAVLRRHRSLGLACREVRAVTALPAGVVPRTEQEKVILQRAVAALEPELAEADEPARAWPQAVF